MTQYFDWLGGIVTGDPGDSLFQGQPILDYIGSRVINSLFLLVLASVVSIPISLVLGAVQAGRRDKAFDQVSSFSMLGLGVDPRVRHRHGARHPVLDADLASGCRQSPRSAPTDRGNTWIR